MPSVAEVNDELKLQSRSSMPRLFELDALRGLAAATVVISHYLLCFRSRSPIMAAVSHIGFAAVCVFFALSGFVLSLPYWANRRSSYGRFVLRRFCRIYLPFLAALALSIAGLEVCRHLEAPALSPWFQGIWHTPLTLGRLLRWLLIPAMPEVNVAFWTLRYEIVMSLLMPLLCFAIRRSRAEIWIGLAWAGLILLQGPLDRLHAPMLDEWLKFGLLFPTGALLAQKREQLRRWAERITALARAAVFAACLVVCYLSPLLQSQLHGRLSLFAGSRVFVAVELAALGVLGSVWCSATLRKLLRHSVMEYLGRISYSLYLVHAIVITAMLRGFYGRMSLALLTALIFATTFALAHIFCVAVEEPSIALGRRLTQRSEVGREAVVAG